MNLGGGLPSRPEFFLATLIPAMWAWCCPDAQVGLPELRAMHLQNPLRYHLGTLVGDFSLKDRLRLER